MSAWTVCHFNVDEINKTLVPLVLFLTPQHANKVTPSIPGVLQLPPKTSNNIVASSVPPTLTILAVIDIFNAVPLGDSPPARGESPFFDGGGHLPQTLHQFLPIGIRVHDLLDGVRDCDRCCPFSLQL